MYEAHTQLNTASDVPQRERDTERLSRNIFAKFDQLEQELAPILRDGIGLSGEAQEKSPVVPSQIVILLQDIESRLNILTQRINL